MSRMIDRRRVMGDKLPYDAEIEYLEGTGTQYIILSLTPSADLTVEVRFKNNSTDNGAIYGNAVNNSIIRLITYIKAYIILQRYRMTGDGVVNIGLDYLWHTAISSPSLCSIDTKTGTPTSTVQSDSRKIYLFAQNSAAKIPFKGFISYFRASDNNGMILDLIPVRVGQVGYMYDKVSGQLFGNNGTGSFILGPDV